MTARFTAKTLVDIRTKYSHTCVVCMKVLTQEGSQCAHLFPKAVEGEEQVGDSSAAKHTAGD